MDKEVRNAFCSRESGVLIDSQTGRLEAWDLGRKISLSRPAACGCRNGATWGWRKAGMVWGEEEEEERKGKKGGYLQFGGGWSYRKGGGLDDD